MKIKRYLPIALSITLAAMALVLTFVAVNAYRLASSFATPDTVSLPLLPAPFVFVGADPNNPANWDIFYMSANGITTNLSTQADVISPTLGNPLFGGSIDNHPALSPDGSQVAFASDRKDGKNVDLYLLDIITTTSAATVTNIIRLTTDPKPERHPHFSEDGSLIIFDAKRKCGPLKPSQCSQPAVPECDYPGTPGDNDGNLYEGIYIFDPNTMTESPLVDPGVADPFWPNNSNEGHASLSQDSRKIIFGADRGQGDVGWEVFMADFLTATQTLANLVQLTDTPGKAISGGGGFDTNAIFFNSTATRNSQLYRITGLSDTFPQLPAEWDRLTDNCANDYVPEHLDDSTLLFTRQVYPDPTNPDIYDLDVWAKDLVGGGEADLTNDTLNDQTLLLGDEVVCFCGGPPNTSGCYIPRVWTMCSVRQMHLIVTGQYTGTLEIPPDYVQRLTEYKQYLHDWVQRYWNDPEHPELHQRALYIWDVLWRTENSQWNPAWCGIQVVLPGFMPPQPPEIIDTEIVELTLQGNSVPLTVRVNDEYCDGCLDLRFDASGGSFLQNLYPDQGTVISGSGWTTSLTTTWTAPLVTQTMTYTLTVIVTDTTGLTDTVAISLIVVPYQIYLPLVIRQADIPGR